MILIISMCTFKCCYTLLCKVKFGVPINKILFYIKYFFKIFYYVDGA